VAWSERFLPVRTSSLELDEPVRPTAKATEAQLRSYALNASEIYRRLAAGESSERLESLRSTGTTAQERALGETYYRMFSDAGGEHRIEADFVDGRLVVQRGRHRVDAAQRAAVPFFPVHVRAQDETTMAALSARVERDASLTSPAIVDYHRQHQSQSRDGAIRTTEKAERETMSFGAEGYSRRKSPEFEPRPQRSEPVAPDPAREQTQRQLGRHAIAGASRSADDARQERLNRALGSAAVEGARDQSRDRDRR